MFEQEQQRKGFNKRGVVIGAVVALVIVAAAIGLGIGFGLQSSSGGSVVSSRDNTTGSTPSPPSAVQTPADQPLAPNGTTSSDGASTPEETPRSPPSRTLPKPNTASTEPLNSTELPLAAVEQFLEIVSAGANSTDQPDLVMWAELLHDNAFMFIRYLRARRLDEVIAFLQAADVPPEQYTDAKVNELVAKLNAAVDFEDFRRWLVSGARDVPKLTPSQLQALRGLEDELDANIIEQFGDDSSSNAQNTTDEPTRDPIEQFAAFSRRLEAAGLDFTNMLDHQNRKDNSSRRKLHSAAGGTRPRKMLQDTPATAADLPQLGYPWFKPARLGLVFHVMQFPTENGTFPGASRSLSRSIAYMVATSNRLHQLSGTGMQFELQEIRADVEKYPYLLTESVQAWQGCAVAQQSCFCLYAATYNVQPTRYVNIWIAGSLNYPGFESGVMGYSSIIPGIHDSCADVLTSATTTTDPTPTTTTTTTTATDPTAFADISAAFATPFPTPQNSTTSPAPGPDSSISKFHSDDIESEDPTKVTYSDVTSASQHLWFNFDSLLLQAPVNPSTYDTGAVILTHEVGHFLGLLHTHEDDCVAVDLVQDTPPNQLIEQQPWGAGALKKWCRALRAGASPDVDLLKQFDSCPDDGYIDNIFNIMSYSSPACFLYFTQGQVQRMQKVSTTYHPGLLEQ